MTAAMTRKNWEEGSKSSAWVENHQKHIRFSPWHQERLQFESQLATGWNEVKTIGHQTQQCEDSWKLWPPFCGELRKGVSHQMWSCKDKTSEQAIETWKIIQGLCLPFLFSWHFVSFCLANMVDSVFICCFLSSQRLLKSGVVNKLLC